MRIPQKKQPPEILKAGRVRILHDRPAVYETQRVLPQTTEPHKKPQLRVPHKWGQMGLVCPVLVAAWEQKPLNARHDPNDACADQRNKADTGCPIPSDSSRVGFLFCGA